MHIITKSFHLCPLYVSNVYLVTFYITYLYIKRRKKLTCKLKEGKMEGFHKEWACYSAKAGKTVWMLFFLDVNFVFLLVLFLCTGWLQYDTWQAPRVRFMYCSKKHAIEQLF